MKLDNLVDNLGRPLPEELQNDLRPVILRTIAHPDSDIPAVVKRAQTIAGKALNGEIRDIVHYAAKALFAVSRKQQRLFRHESLFAREPSVMVDLAGAAVHGSPAAIEAKILIDQLLSALPKIECDVFLRHTMGWKHRQIGQDLGISVAMSSYYLLQAKARLKSIVDKRQSFDAGEL